MSRTPHSLWSDREILSTLSALVTKERVSTVEILRLINEVDRRQLFVPLGFTSIFDYCTRRLKYSSSSAMRRIDAARVIRRFPESALLLEAGDVNLSTLSLIEDVLTEENRTELLERIRGKSQRDVEGIVAEHKPPVGLRDRVRTVMVAASSADDLPRSNVSGPRSAGGEQAPTLGENSQNPRNPLSFHCRCGSETGAGGADSLQSSAHERADEASAHRAATRTLLERKFQIQFLAGANFMKKLERARALLSNRLEERTFEKVFEAMMDEFLERHSPESKDARREKRAAKPTASSDAKKGAAKAISRGPTPSHSEAPGTARDATGPRCARQSSRHIPASVRDEVFMRDNGQCTFVSHTGDRCGATHNLQIDHIVPFGRGGGHDAENLRLRCGKHNRLEAERVYGAAVASRYKHRE